ncbi:DoxX family protein [Ktedonospora formicarum]|uniref:DoxX family protein n=1 Tax=Ktedonospora formicarum TaxID=2778364 RepID=A0A8J3I5C0_9CHLR|nr:DoxX family protein [Ktedonospora formicarum]GHO46188.1 hypothetical protein KSX_43510 [Ktedonospora formicarum]
MFWIAVVLQILLALAFLGSGATKLTRQKQMVDNFENRYHYPLWFMTITGVIEVIAALALIAGIWAPVLATLGVLLVICTMIGAIATHIRIKDTLPNIIAPTILFVLSVVLLFVHQPMI